MYTLLEPDELSLQRYWYSRQRFWNKTLILLKLDPRITNSLRSSTYQVLFVISEKFLRPLSEFVPLIEQAWSPATASTEYSYSSYTVF